MSLTQKEMQIKKMECDDCKHKTVEGIPDCVIDGCCPEVIDEE